MADKGPRRSSHIHPPASLARRERTDENRSRARIPFCRPSPDACRRGRPPLPTEPAAPPPPAKYDVTVRYVSTPCPPQRSCRSSGRCSTSSRSRASRATRTALPEDEEENRRLRHPERHRPGRQGPRAAASSATSAPSASSPRARRCRRPMRRSACSWNWPPGRGPIPVATSTTPRRCARLRWTAAPTCCGSRSSPTRCAACWRSSASSRPSATTTAPTRGCSAPSPPAGSTPCSTTCAFSRRRGSWSQRSAHRQRPARRAAATGAAAKPSSTAS